MDYLVLSEDLAMYDLPDIEAGLDLLKRREDYQPAFPHIGMLEDAIAGVIRKRRADERRAEEARRDAAEEQHRRDHPEEYAPVRDVWAAVMERARGKMDMPDTPREDTAPPADKDGK